MEQTRFEAVEERLGIVSYLRFRLDQIRVLELKIDCYTNQMVIRGFGNLGKGYRDSSYIELEGLQLLLTVAYLVVKVRAHLRFSLSASVPPIG